MTLTDEEKRLIELVRQRPQSIDQFEKVIRAMIYQADDRDRKRAANSAEIIMLLGLQKDRRHLNAMKKAAAMVVLYRYGMSHSNAQASVGLRSDRGHSSRRAMYLHPQRIIQDDDYRQIFYEVEKKIVEWGENKHLQKGEA